MNSAELLKKQTAELSVRLQHLINNKALQSWIDFQNGRKESALTYWKKAAQADDDRGLQAKRSLAVYYHSLAYDDEIKGNQGSAHALWREALKYWALIFGSSAFGMLNTRFNVPPIDPLAEALLFNVQVLHNIKGGVAFRHEWIPIGVVACHSVPYTTKLNSYQVDVKKIFELS